MMTSVGHGMSIDITFSPSPANRGQSCSCQVKIKNGKTPNWEVLHENQITGAALEFDGCTPVNVWPKHGIFVPGNTTVTDPHPLKVPSGSKTDEYVQCVSVELEDPILRGNPILCTQNMPVLSSVLIR
jgi:hypothetical protein